MTRTPSRQRGVALLTVLLLVAVMGVLVMATLDDVRFGLRRAGNVQALEQAQWHARGVAALARSQVEAMQRLDPAVTLLDGNWEDVPRPLPLPGEEGGLAVVRVTDGGNCFNLNSVVEGAPGQWQYNATGARQYQALLEALGVDDARARSLADALVDWIDSDASPRPMGAEDNAYQAADPARRTSGTLLAEPSELRAIAGYDAALYARLRPWACALPDDRLSPLNVNTLRPDDAPLLTMLTLGALPPAHARSVISARPPGGWRDNAVFWSLPALAAANAPAPVIGQTALRTRYFGLDVRVSLGEAEAVLTETFEVADDGRTHLLAHRWTLEE